MRSPTAFISGGAGFVGSSLVRELSAEGWQVTAYDKLAPGRAAFLPADDPRVELVVGDVLDEEQLGAALIARKPDVVFHLAALHYIPYCNAHPLETLRVNVEGTHAVLRACAAAGVGRLVFASTAAVYPAQAGPLSEELAPGPLDIYGHSKLFGEQLVEWHQRQTASSCVIARLFNVYGPRETSRHLIPELLDQIIEGAETVALGNLEPKRDYVHVADVAAALHRLARSTEGRPAGLLRVNVGTGVERSAREVLEELRSLAGRPVGLRQDAARMRPSDRPHLCADVSRLRALLNWAPSTDFRAGLAELLRSAAAERERSNAVGE